MGGTAHKLREHSNNCGGGKPYISLEEGTLHSLLKGGSNTFGTLYFSVEGGSNTAHLA